MTQAPGIAWILTLRIIFITPCVMPWKKPLKSILCLFLSLPFFTFAGGDKPTQPPVVVDDLDCDDMDLVLSNHKYPNPMKEEYRPARDLMNALNNKFYAVLEGRVATRTVIREGKKVQVQFAEIPMYTWFEKHDGFNVYNYFQRMDYFDMWGCYRGSCCYPVSVLEERTRYVPLKKWVPWKQICQELDNPKNGVGLKQKVLKEIKSGNLYGLMEVKGMSPNRDIVFLDRYTPWIESDEHLPEAQGGGDSSRAQTPTNKYSPSKKLESASMPTEKEFEEIQSPVEQIVPPPPSAKEKPKAPATVENDIDTEAPAAPVKPATPPKTVLSEDIPLAKRVPGKEGFVYNPFLNDGSMINVEDIPAGIKKAKDPTTGKIFRLP